MASVTTTTLCHCHLPLSSSFTIPKPIHSLSLSPSTRALIRPFHFQFQSKSKSISSSSSRCLISQPPRAYVTGPASDPNISEPDPKLHGSLQEKIEPPSVITWELLSMLLTKHKLRLALCVASLFSCTACTLSMPIFSGNFYYFFIYCIHFTPFIRHLWYHVLNNLFGSVVK